MRHPASDDPSRGRLNPSGCVARRRVFVDSCVGANPFPRRCRLEALAFLHCACLPAMRLAPSSPLPAAYCILWRRLARRMRRRCMRASVGGFSRKGRNSTDLMFSSRSPRRRLRRSYFLTAISSSIAAFGLAGATKRVTMNGKGVSEKLVLNAGALRVVGMLGDSPINASKSQISIFVPERNNSEAKLVVSNAKAGDNDWPARRQLSCSVDFVGHRQQWRGESDQFGNQRRFAGSGGQID